MVVKYASLINKALVVVPTFREVGNLPKLFDLLERIDLQVDLLVIDDGSDDGTSEALEQRARDSNRLTVLQRHQKLGLGTAYTLAASYAKQAGYLWIVQMDADLSHDPNCLVKLIESCADVDMSIGSRYVAQAGVDDAWPLARRLISRGANALVNLGLGLPIRDATSGFRCTTGSLLRRLPLEKMMSCGFSWQWEFNRLVFTHGGTVREVPIIFGQRFQGQSKMSRAIMLEGIKRLIQIRLLRRRGRQTIEGNTTVIEKTAESSLTRRQATHLLVVVGLSVLSFSDVKASAPEDASNFIEYAYVDRAHRNDPGTVVVVLRNSGSSLLKIGEIRVDGQVLSDWPKADQPVAWHRLTRQTLEPKTSGLLVVKLAQPISGLLRIVVESDEGVAKALVDVSEPQAIRIVALRYAPDGTALRVFVENTGRSAVFLKSLVFGDKTIWHNKDGLKLGPGEVLPLWGNLRETLNTGQRIQVLLCLSDRTIGVTGRAIPGFRLSVESGDRAMAQRIGADPLVLDTYKFTEETADHAGDAAPTLAARQGKLWSMVRPSHGKFLTQEESDLVCAFVCPTHSTDSYQTSAYLGMNAQQEVDTRPAWQSFIHCCRTQPLAGIAVFGQIADAVRFNAALDTDVATENIHRDTNPWKVYSLTRYAARVAAPSIAIPMIMLQKDWKLFPGGAPQALDVRQMIYAALAGGAGGVSYRVREDEWGNESRDLMLDAVKQANAEIHQVRSLLAFGYPRPLAVCSEPYVQTVCIDAAPYGLVVVVVNHDVERSPPELPPSVTAVTKTDLPITIQLPAEFRDVAEQLQVRSIMGADSAVLHEVTTADGVLTITLNTLSETTMLVVEQTPKSGEQR